LASLKHVPSCEKSPLSAVNTNILGSKVVAAAAMHHKLQKFYFHLLIGMQSTNVMGATKLIVERFYTA
jgi:FlaA1/EpsC-like NDP-sugar epimerase